MAKIEDTLAERSSNYGNFYDQAKIVQTLKDVMKNTKNWKDLPDDMKEALEMTAHKISRILNGDPYFHDSWHDIVGYVKLVADRLLNKDFPPSLETQVQMLWAQPEGPIDDE